MKRNLSLLLLAIAGIVMPFAAAGQKGNPNPAPHSFEFGMAISGKTVSFDIWSKRDADEGFGFFYKLLWDENNYENGATVNVCSDGSVSGSSGSGTCSGHGGISHSKLAGFERNAFILGPTYGVSNRVRLHSGLIIGTYTSDITVGNETKLDFTEYGVEIGVSYSMFSIDGPRLVLSYESEQGMRFTGICFPF